MVGVGDRLELEFEVRAVLQSETWSGAFSRLITRPTFVSVYMRNNTGSCERQLRQLREATAELDAAGFGLVAVSKDTTGSHLKAAQRLGLTIPLVSDPDHAFVRATDSLVEKRLYGRAYKGPSRSAFLIDASGFVLAVVERVDAARHREQLLEIAREKAQD